MRGLDPASGLEEEHQPDAIRARLEHKSGRYLPSAVLGSIDGCVTTFAIVAGAEGGALPPVVIIVLGLANLLADGFSMAVGNYNAGKSRHDQLARARRVEQLHIDAIPAGEREETRQILIGKGLGGEPLEQALASITQNRRLWVDFMVSEEWGLRTHEPPAVNEALVTFAAFVTFGSVPLAPYLVSGTGGGGVFGTSILLTAIAFAAVGFLKGIATDTSPFRASAQTLLTGAGASLLAYSIGAFLRSWLSVS